MVTAGARRRRGVGHDDKQAGGTARLAFAHEDLSVQWYTSVGAMFKGLEKNLFGPGSDYRWWLMLLQVGMIWGVSCGCAFLLRPDWRSTHYPPRSPTHRSTRKILSPTIVMKIRTTVRRLASRFLVACVTPALRLPAQTVFWFSLFLYPAFCHPQLFL